jgi:hypothetical protein
VTDSSHSKTSDAQEELARRVRQRLEHVGARFAERFLEHPVEATIEFKLEVREPDRLTAGIDIGIDGFWFTANGAALHLEIQDAGNDAMRGSSCVTAPSRRYSLTTYGSERDGLCPAVERARCGSSSMEAAGTASMSYGRVDGRRSGSRTGSTLGAPWRFNNPPATNPFTHLM